MINKGNCKYFLSFIFLACSLSSAIAAQNKYQDEAISFYYPDDWELSTDQGRNLEIKLRPKDWLCANKSSEIEVDDFALYISISHGNLESAAVPAGFINKGSKWKLEGRQGAEGEVEEIKDKNWKGIIGEAPVGVFYKGGGYFGLGWASTAVISDGTRVAVISGSELGSQSGQNILKSIEFINKKK